MYYCVCVSKCKWTVLNSSSLPSPRVPHLLSGKRPPNGSLVLTVDTSKLFLLQISNKTFQCEKNNDDDHYEIVALILTLWNCCPDTDWVCLDLFIRKILSFSNSFLWIGQNKTFWKSVSERVSEREVIWIKLYFYCFQTKCIHIF